MIVRSEAHIIEETLNSIKDYISFWVISDTGSTDNTKEIIVNFFKKHNIPGQLVEHKWKDFGTNRTLALEACYPHRKKFDYIWTFDADDLVVGKIQFPYPFDKSVDMYSLKYGDGFTYMRNQVFKASEKWKYVGVLHEYPALKDKRTPKVVPIEGNYYIDSRRLGARNKDENKYLRDVATLLRGLQNEPKNERYMFYLAQSYMDAGDYKNAIKWYKKRIECKGWFEEVYYSYYRVATCMQNDGAEWEKVQKAFMDAWQFLPSRAEPLYEIAKHYRSKGDYQKGYVFAKQASSIIFPKDQVLFLFKEIYDYKALEEYQICAHFSGKYGEAFSVGNNLLKKNLPEYERKKIEKNRDLSIEYIMESYTKYPAKKISEIRGNNVDTKNIIFTITTCKRYDLFHKTVNSFINCCEDVLKIDKWLCVDDNSSAEDREKMQKLYPFFEFIWKGEEQKGHVQSMNIIYERIRDYKYACHMEDDWSFFETRNYLTESINILESESKYGQLLFNVNYAQRSSCRKIAGGFVKYVDGIRIVEHEYYPSGAEYDNFISRNAGRSTQAYWPHYSLRPSVLRVNALKDIGDYLNETGHFEMDYAKRYVEKGYRSAFLDTICSYHIGKCTWEKGDNSYSLNGVKQFNDIEKMEEKVEDDDVWLVVDKLDSFGNDIKFLNTGEIEILKLAALSDETCIGFNSLGYLKSVIYEANSWIDVSANFSNFKMYIHKERYANSLKK